MNLTPIVGNFDIPAPVVLRRRASPMEIGRTDLRQLCKVAEIDMRVTGGQPHPVVLHKGVGHFKDLRGTYYVGIGGVGGVWKKRDRTQALQILEILTYGFHDYAACECVCGFKLFVPASREKWRYEKAEPALGASRRSTTKKI